MSETYDVAIVGYGPTGLVLASALGRFGHRVLVIERWPGLYGLPRLTHIDGETARIIQAVADVDHALRDCRPIDNYRYLNAAGETLVDLDFGGESCGFPAHIAMYQPDIEDAVDARVRTYPNVDVKQGHVLVAFEQHEDRVTLAYRVCSRDGQQWIVGAGIARDLCLTGRRIDAAEAHRLGLVNQIADADSLLDDAFATARVIAEAPQAALKATKRYLTSSAGVTFDEAFAVEHDRVFDEFLLGAFGPGPAT